MVSLRNGALLVIGVLYLLSPPMLPASLQTIQHSRVTLLNEGLLIAVWSVMDTEDRWFRCSEGTCHCRPETMTLSCWRQELGGLPTDQVVPKDVRVMWAYMEIRHSDFSPSVPWVSHHFIWRCTFVLFRTISFPYKIPCLLSKHVVNKFTKARKSFTDSIVLLWYLILLQRPGDQFFNHSPQGHISRSDISLWTVSNNSLS
jgi:hypothetical protein